MVNNAYLMLVLYLGFEKTVVISLYKGLEDVGHTILSGRDVQVTPSMVSRTPNKVAHSNGDMQAMPLYPLRADNPTWYLSRHTL